MADEQIKVCDVKDCGRRGNQVERHKIEFPAGIWQADLCGEHSAPLRSFAAGFPPHFLVKVRQGGRTTGIQIHTMEEIERMKGD